MERKLALPPEQVSAVMDAMPKAKDFEWLDK
jgi:hypothetical protein